jgi:hypothetical protein
MRTCNVGECFRHRNRTPKTELIDKNVSSIFLSLLIYIYTYYAHSLCARTYAHVCVCVRARGRACVRACVRVSASVRACARVCASARVRVCACLCAKPWHDLALLSANRNRKPFLGLRCDHLRQRLHPVDGHTANTSATGDGNNFAS